MKGVAYGLTSILPSKSSTRCAVSPSERYSSSVTGHGPLAAVDMEHPPNVD